MALNAFANHPSTTQRHKQLSRTLIGDFTFALERHRTRQKLFLQRNIALILAYHKHHLGLDQSDPTSNPVRPGLLAPRIESATALPSNGHLSVTTTPSGAGNHTSPPESGPRPQSTTLKTMRGRGASSHPARIDDQVKERRTRRSDRFKDILDKVYNQVDAELVLDLKNIRKKLNFKSNFLEDGGERPAKRQKRDTVRCFCHLTIWDNRERFVAIPLTTKSSFCRVTSTENGAHGFFVDLELEEPFTVKATEIRVPVDTSKSSSLEIIDNYFLEIKIIPCREDSRWPPMPVLGKSDGDHFAHDIKKTGSEELQGSIVARYTHLPTAPDGDVPLSVFFLHEGRTYRTKYGLQVSSTWQNAGAGVIKQEDKGINLESFLQPPANPERAQPSTEPEQEPSPSRLESLRRTARPNLENQPEVCYSFSGAGADEPDLAQEFRNATTQGYRCPLCSALSFHKLSHLEFHLTNTHSKYTFSVVQKGRRNRLTNDLAQITIKVTQAVRTTVKKDDAENEKRLNWVAPNAPFDLDAFVSGDHSWASGKVSAKPDAKQSMSNSSHAHKKGPRRYPLAKDVPDFRVANRKKWKAIPLETKNDDDEPELVYTSISHRAVSPSEDARSETDDEIDNEWQIATHMERLDLIAAEEQWSPYRRELTKRWDRHRMEEQLEHSYYLSNSLIRFARKQKEWLKNSEDDELLLCFFEFLGRLKERNVIDDNVVVDVNELIFQDVSATAPETAEGRMSGSVKLHAATSSRSAGDPRDQTTLQPPPRGAVNTCPLCAKSVRPMHPSTTFCQDPTCLTPLQKYHKKCALAGPRSVKGKERAAESAPLGFAKQDEELRLKRFSCEQCKSRRAESVLLEYQKNEEKNKREREIVEEATRRFLGSMK
jgi:hypothetical protein